MDHPITVERDSNNTFLVSFPDLPWVHTYGETREGARTQAADALLTAFTFLIKARRMVPTPTRRARGEHVPVPAMVAAKVGLSNGSQVRILPGAPAFARE